LNAVRALQLKAGVMWLRIITKRGFRLNYSQHFPACLVRRILLAAIFLCLLGSPSYGFLEGQSKRIKLSDKDQAAIIQSVLREIFNPKSNYEGTHYILAEGVRPEWVPRISGYTLKVVTRMEINSFEENPHYYVIRLEPMANSVEVTLNLYNREDERNPEVYLYYSYRRINSKWRGKYLYGGGN
jgi:hypothetical protein